jgi:hypothetical protein
VGSPSDSKYHMSKSTKWTGSSRIHEPTQSAAWRQPPAPRPVRVAKQRHQRVERLADLAGLEQPLGGGPLRRHPQLVADAQHAPRAFGAMGFSSSTTLPASSAAMPIVLYR